MARQNLEDTFPLSLLLFIDPLTPNPFLRNYHWLHLEDECGQYRMYCGQV